VLRVRPLPPFSWDGLSPSAVSPLVGADVKPQSLRYELSRQGDNGCAIIPLVDRLLKEQSMIIDFLSSSPNEQTL